MIIGEGKVDAFQVVERILAVLGSIASILALFQVTVRLVRKRISWRTFSRTIQGVVRKIQRKGNKYDLVIGVRRSGTVCAAIVAGNLGGLPVYALNVDIEKSNHGLQAMTAKVDCNGVSASLIKGKKILVVACFNVTGVCPKVALEYLESFGPSAMDFVAVYESSYSQIGATIVGQAVSKAKAEEILIAMPWMVNEAYVHPHSR